MKHTPSTPHRGGIYLLPNLVTIAAMFAGFYAIIAGLKGSYEQAVIAILIAIFFDALDGRVARWMHSSSEMGAQLDSLSDMIGFGIAPAMVAYSFSLSVLGKMGWLVAFFYAVCTALRLARFNSSAQNQECRYFFGLNTPSSAAFLISTIWVCVTHHISGPSVAVFLSITMVCLGFLKISTIRYRNFKDIDWYNKRVSFCVIMSVIVFLVLFLWNPPEMLWFLALIYIVSAPVGMCWYGLSHRK